MLLTLDSLLIDETDRTSEWEEEFGLRNQPKLKYPVKIVDHNVFSIDLDFKDPEINDPPKKKSNRTGIIAKTITLGTKGKKEKNKLF